MAKNPYLSKLLFIPALLLCYLLCGFVLERQSIQADSPPGGSTVPDKPEPSVLSAVVRAEIGVREKSGRNDGKRVEEYLAYVHLKKGNPWCAAFVCWALGKAGIQNPRSGYSPALFPESQVIWRKGGITGRCLRSSGCLTPGRPPQQGDIFGIFFPEKGRIAHVGFVESWGDTWVITVEGNTNEAGSREGDGVYRKRRLKGSLYRVARWI